MCLIISTCILFQNALLAPLIRTYHILQNSEHLPRETSSLSLPCVFSLLVLHIHFEFVVTLLSALKNVLKLRFAPPSGYTPAAERSLAVTHVGRGRERYSSEFQSNSRVRADSPEKDEER